MKLEVWVSICEDRREIEIPDEEFKGKTADEIRAYIDDVVGEEAQEMTNYGWVAFGINGDDAA